MEAAVVTTIAAINLKGGCSKTTTCINLAGVYQESGQKPLILDLDPQKSASFWARQGGDTFPYPVAAIEMGDIKQFKAQMDQLVKQHSANLVIFDCPPALASEALVAALLADLVLVPVSPSPLDIVATQEAVSTIREARKERKGHLPKAVLVPSRLVKGTVLAREIQGTLKELGEPIAPSISMRVALVEASIKGEPIHKYAPGSHSHLEFKNLMKFINTNLRKS
jgi:chromosome partitioning protein